MQVHQLEGKRRAAQVFDVQPVRHRVGKDADAFGFGQRFADGHAYPIAKRSNTGFIRTEIGVVITAKAPRIGGVAKRPYFKRPGVKEVRFCA